MATGFQITLDCADPNRLAAFWALALGYKLEDPPPGFATWEDWLRANNVPEEQWDSRAAIVDPQGIGPRFWLQKVPEPKLNKNRFHLDLRSSPPGTPWEERPTKAKAKAVELVAAGATILYEMTELGQFWITMADPEGNEFCVG
jgi:hypothetical protein